MRSFTFVRAGVPVMLLVLLAGFQCATTWRDRVPEDITCVKGRGRVAALRVLERARAFQFKTEREIRTHYKIEQLDKLRLYSNQRVRGAIVCHNKKILYIHTTAGVMRVRKAEIQTQEF